MRTIFGVLAAVALLSGCKSEPEPVVAPTPASPTAPPTGNTPSATAGLRGTVLETHPAGSYTYLRLQTASGEQWAAVPSVEAKIGSEVVVKDPAMMTDFKSKTLDRTFPQIAFGSGLEGQAPAGAAPVPSTPSKAEGSSAARVEPVEKAAGPEGRTIAELYASGKSLEGKPVAVRAKVVKFTPGIMDRNWIHLQDGSGSAERKDHDVTVTTTETVAVGDVVTLKGKVVLNKDLGSGYVYPVLIEDASIVR